MGRIVVSENISLDGVIEDPTGDEGTARGGWFLRVEEADRTAFAEFFSAEVAASAALLLGRRTCRWFGERWSAREGAWADRLNAMPKYVVSSSTADPGWSNATVLTESMPGAVAGLRARVDGDLVVYGSGRLARSLFEAGLVDEVRLLVYPSLLGEGDRLFPSANGPDRLDLLEVRRLGATLALLRYAVTGG